VLGKPCFSGRSLLRGAAVAVSGSSWAELGWFGALAGQNDVFELCQIEFPSIQAFKK